MKSTDRARRKAAGGRRDSKAKNTFRSFVTEVTIESLGGLGEGVAHHEGQTLFVPMTVPGDRVLVRVETSRGSDLGGTVIELMEAGESRVAPPCPWFGTCGGCALQHLEDGAYKSWKEGLVAQALSRQGIVAPVSPMVRIAPGTRRRAVFAFAHRKDGIQVGFHRRNGHDSVAINRCLLLRDEINAFLPALRAGLAPCVPKSTEGAVSVSWEESGLDVVIEAPLQRTLFVQEALANFASENDLARLSWNAPGQSGVETLFRRRAAMVSFDGLPVEAPPGAFLQPSREGQAALLEHVLAGLDGVKGTVLDLYCGCGTFSLPLARHNLVRAVDGEASSVAALTAAAIVHGLPVRTEVRDLARRPLLPAELKGVSAVVFDPPRTGALAQVEQIVAAGKVGIERIVAVSCNPATFARDAARLLAGPYEIVSVVPIDQFAWSYHLEVVAVFRLKP